jgi:hypothetical protein
MPRSKNPNHVRLASLKPTLATLDGCKLATLSTANAPGHRQYATNDRRWRRIREQVVIRDRYKCADCGNFCTAPRDAHVDHVDGNAHNNDLSNLVTRCASCHSKKTASRDGGFGNPTAR